MPEWLKLNTWRAANNKEIGKFLDSAPANRSLLILRTHLRPVDIYAYLKARFGAPNGIQELLRRDDSNNLIHWDFNIRAGEVDLYFSGHSRSIQVIVSEPMTDEDWKRLILAIKEDFWKFGTEKSAVTRSLEKFVRFQNKYVSLANLCADLHSDIIDAGAAEALPLSCDYGKDPTLFKEAMNRLAQRGEKLFGDCLKLRLLTPVMVEVFINMIILLYCNDSVRNDKAVYESFLRATIPERLSLLRQNCFAFVRAIDTTTATYASFMRIFSKRNFELHGNVDPLRERIETVYFDGKRPLFVEPGNHIEKFFEHLERIQNPQEAVKDYEDAHAFLHEIVECLDSQYRFHFDQVINDPFPGFEVNKRRPTRILPDQVVMSIMQGSRYDDELKVEW